MRNGAEILLPQGIRPDFAARTSPETERPQIIYYAGKSPKREALLRMLVEAEGKVFDNAPGGPEDNKLDPKQIAAGKIDYAISLLTADEKINPNSETQTVIIAADAQIHSSYLKPDGKTALRTSGKPKNPYDVMQLFQGMIDSAKATGDKRNYGYLMEAGSESRTIIGTRIISIAPDPNFFYVALGQQAVDFFATPDGARQYLNELNRFLRSPQYLNNGVEEPGSPTEICGALDLVVLKKLRAVRRIDRTPRENHDEAEDMLKSAIFAAYVGFNISVLEQVNPNAKVLVGQWPWFQKVTDYALN